MNELLNELLTMLDQNVIRIQPYTLDDSERSMIEARISNWIGRARMVATAPIDPKHCYLCDRPKADCACVVEDFV